MKLWTSFTFLSLITLALGAVGCQSTKIGGVTSAKAQTVQQVGQQVNSTYETPTPDGAKTEASGFAIARYRLESSQSRFMVRAFAGGLLWFKGHDHLIAARDFSGEAQLTLGASPPASLQITFKSTDVTGQLTGSQFEAKIGGDLTLHGVTRHIVIPATVMLSGGDLRARGEFTINRSDYNVKATSAFHGLVRVRGKLKFTFDIVGHQV